MSRGLRGQGLVAMGYVKGLGDDPFHHHPLSTRRVLFAAYQMSVCCGHVDLLLVTYGMHVEASMFWFVPVLHVLSCAD